MNPLRIGLACAAFSCFASAGHGLVVVRAGSPVFHEWREFQHLARGTR